MLPILNKPLIQYGVEEALEAGMTEIAFVTGRGKRAIEDHFDINYEIEHEIEGTASEKSLEGIREIIARCRFSYTRQMKIEGLGNAVLTGETLIGSEPFGVVLADDLCITNGPGVLTQMLQVFEKYRCSVVAVEEVAKADTGKYGIIAGTPVEEGLIRVTDMVEKPDTDKAPSNLGIIGRYILTPDIFDILRFTRPGHGGEIQLTDALRKQAEQRTLVGYRIKAKRFDCGSIDGYAAAMNYVYENSHTVATIVKPSAEYGERP